jgi:hypothetical protein
MAILKYSILLKGSDLDDSQVASDDDNNFQGYLMFGF